MMYFLIYLTDNDVFPLRPVITIVLNFSNTPWKNKNLFTDEKICHVQEFMDFLAVFTNDIRYKEIKQELAEMEKEGRSVTMCNVAQALEEKGIERGIQQEKISRIQKMIRKGCSKEDILEWDYTEEEYLEAESGLLTV